MKVVDAETNLYRVPFAEIKPAKEFDDMDFSFFNPRILDQKNKEIYGFSKEEMDSLKDSIRTKGLMETMNVNYNENQIGLIDGHRRHEAIRQLIEENTSCYDVHNNTWVSAKDLYKEVVVKMYHNLNSSECFSRAFHSDTNKVSFGENATIRFVDYCISFNMAEKKIVDMTGKSISWLRYITKLISKVNADKQIKQALLEGKINASTADSIMNIQDEEERNSVFETALNKAKEDYDQKLKKQDLVLKNTRRKIEIANNKKKQAEETGDIGEIQDAESLLEKHTNTLAEKTREKSEISPKINNKNLEEALTEVGVEIDEIGDDGDSNETPTKTKTKNTSKSIKDTWLKEIKASVDRGHLTESGESIPPIINQCLSEVIKSIFEYKTSYEDFINEWVPKFIEGGLQHDAGFKPKINVESESDGETGDIIE